MKFENTKVWGLENAIIGMRLPMCKDYKEARNNCDSWFSCNSGTDCNFDGCDYIKTITLRKKDLDLCQRLIKADEKGDGTPNSKFLRMIHVQVAVTAQLYVFKELDTYKVATVANSTSTMHKLASTPITIDCFEMGDFENLDLESQDMVFPLKATWESLISDLEFCRQKYNETKDKRYWKELIRLLPESWLQTRMLDLNYATLRSIYTWRRGHKLTEWHRFCEWIESLPYAKELLTSGGC
jgi:hypothetical protein